MVKRVDGVYVVGRYGTMRILYDPIKYVHDFLDFVPGFFKDFEFNVVSSAHPILIYKKVTYSKLTYFVV
jgi:hypothetical protein